MNITLKTKLLSIFICIVLMSFFSKDLKAQTTYNWNGSNSSAWNNNLNWTPNTGFPGSADNVVITSSGASPVLDITRSVTNFTISGGTLNLNTCSLTITGIALFTNGNVNNGSIAPTGTIATFFSTTFGANIKANCSSILLNGGTFNNSANFLNNGAANISCNGGNTFNGVTVIATSGTGNLTLSNFARDIFNNDVTFSTSVSIIYAASNGTAGTQFNGNVTVVSTGTSSSIRFCQGSGNATLANAKSLSVGVGGFSGHLYLKKFVQLGATPQIITNFLGTAALYLQSGNIFNGNVTAIAPSLLLDGTTFNGTATLEKSGVGNNFSQGGNTFNAATSIINSGSGELLLAGTNRDIFNGDVTVTSSGSSKINMAYNDNTGTLFNGNLFLNSTGSSSGLNFSNGAGTCTLAAGKTINVGGSGFSSGVLYFRKFTQAGTTAQSMTTFSGTSTLQFGDGTTFNGNVTFSAPQIMSRATTYNGNATLTKTGATTNSWYGSNVFNGTANIVNSGSGILDLASTLGDDFNGDATFKQTGSARISPLVSGFSTFAGNISTVGSNAVVNFGYGWSTGRMIIDGNTIQKFNGSAAFPPSVATLSIAAVSSTLQLNANLTILGDLINNGTLVDSSQLIKLAGFNPQQIGGTSLITFKNLTLSNLAGSYLSANENISGVLMITSGTFSTTGYNFKLISDANGTALIAPILGGFAGNITMQRYLASGPSSWRFIASPVSGATIIDWQDNFMTTGFPGSNFPNFNFASIYTYDETTGGTSNNGYNAASSVTDAIVPGKGYWCYIDGTAPVTIDVTGPPVKSSYTFQLSYTPSAGPSEDGYVMIGNPYPSPIDWSSAAWIKSKINNAVYIWNPALQQYASWVSGVGTNGGSNTIASSQAFWVQTNSANPVLISNENVKVSTNMAFMRPQNQPNTNTLKLNFAGNNYKDETYLLFNSNATKGYDSDLDARKLFSATPGVPGIATQDSTLVDMSINSLPLINSVMQIPVKTIVGTSGNYFISVDSSSTMQDFCIVLEDLVTGTKTNLNSSSGYSFEISDTTTAARFILQVSASHKTKSINASCNNYQDGKAIAIGNGAGPWNYVWFNSNNGNLQQTLNTFAADTLMNLGAGNYSVQISDSNGMCGTSIKTISIAEPLPVYAGFITNNDSLFIGNSDSLVIQNTATGATSCLWNFGDGSSPDSSFIPPIHRYNTPGTFTITQIARHDNCSDSICKKITVVRLSVAGVQNRNDETNLQVYPNPSKGLFSVKIDHGPRTPVFIEVFNVSGQTVYESMFISEQTTIDLSHCAKGIYFYRIKPGNKLSQQGKLIIE